MTLPRPLIHDLPSIQTRFGLPEDDLHRLLRGSRRGVERHARMLHITSITTPTTDKGADKQ
jgi:hypothetical protein